MKLAAAMSVRHPSTLTSINNLAEALTDQGKYAEAEKMDRETLALRKEVLGGEHPSTVLIMRNLENILNKQRKHADMEETEDKRRH